jgi:hypothetical protein
MAMLLFFGCSRKEVSQDDVNRLFRIGMSMEEVTRAYGKPQFTDETAGIVRWNYYPDSAIKKNREGEFLAYIIEFKDSKTSAITFHTMIKGR